ncbi:MAG: esterase-like activity of phytase family protein, partial [Rhizobiaceae bacterium]|nr:esterase-like activity of phytase family protein [Rhizobiaceae bacterium]
MKRLCRATMLVMLLAGCGSMDTSDGGPADIHATAIPYFQPGAENTRFDGLEFLGGLELSSSDALFGAVSAIRFRPDQRHFVSVLDTGHWLTGAIERGEDGRLKGIVDASIMPMIDRGGEAHAGKGEMDAEGVALRGKSVLVSYERDHRVDTYPDPGFETSRPDGSIPILIPKKRLSSNRSLEALMIAPETSPLAGAAVIVSERSLDHDGNMLAAVLEGPLKGRFTVRHSDDFDVSDGVFLPDGDLLLLERRFNLAHGIGVRIVRIAGADIKPGAVVDGKVIFEAGSNRQIDNMEGL